jgi:hypothetical protein
MRVVLTAPIELREFKRASDEEAWDWSAATDYDDARFVAISDDAQHAVQTLIEDLAAYQGEQE